MNKMRKYQLNIALESTLILGKIMGIHRKRPVDMARWRKLCLYAARALSGKSGANNENQ